ncbi:MAG TPA: DUF3750 domain-containing protein [Thermodesulfobacteriota bacterium]
MRIRGTRIVRPPVTIGRLAALLALVLVLAVAVQACARASAGHWSQARWDSAGIAPDPATIPEAVVQVYAARVWGWRGALGVHTWIAVKPSDAPAWTTYDVTGWGVRRGRPAVRIRSGIPDGYWAGSEPELLFDRRGEGVDDLIARIEAAARSYPYADTYTMWPGPNSNTFVAHVAREAGLRLDLPPTAIGKDYLPNGSVAALSPSGTGVQVSLFGLLGVMLAAEEGVEVNVLGLTFGIDLWGPALKLPGVGRVGAR